MKEGKNLHFRDNKPLCSYSIKLCRQRRLNGYAFCIRHILEDTSAPFKQCSYVTKNNHQKCLNAIPLKIDRGYCHSHLQLAGIIPKTERKIKPSLGKNGNTNSISNSTPPALPASINGFKKDSEVLDSQNNNNNKHQDDLNSTKSILQQDSQFSNQSSNNSFTNGNNYGNIKHNLQNHTPILNGKNSHVTNGTIKINGKLNTEANEDIFPQSPPTTVNKLPPKNNYSKKCQQQKQLSNNSSTFQSSSNLITNGTSTSSVSTNKVKEQLYNSIISNYNYGKKSVVDVKNGELSTNVSVAHNKLTPNSPNNNISSTIPSKTTTSPVDRWKILSKFQSNQNQNQDGFNNVKRKGEEFLINGTNSNSEDVKSVLCFMKKKNYEQWKALNILEKLPLFSEDKSGNGKLNQTPGTTTLSQDIYPTRSLDIVLVPPILNGKTKSKEYLYQNDSKEPESRQEFLSRVRKAFKSHLKTIKNVVKLGEKQERGVKRCFRESLMFCVVNDPNYTAQVLLKSDPRFKPNEAGGGNAATTTTADEVDEIINNKNRQIIDTNTNKSKLLPCINTLNTTITTTTKSTSSLFTSDNDDIDNCSYDYVDEDDAGKNENVIRLNAFVETMDNNSDVQVICERKGQDIGSSSTVSQIQQPKGVSLCQSLSSSENNLDAISWNSNTITNTKFKTQVNQNGLNSSLTPCRKIKANGVRTNGSTLLNSKSESMIIPHQQQQQQQLNTKVNGKIKKTTSSSDFGLNSNYLKKPRIENGGFKDIEYPKGLSLNGQLNQHLQGTLNNIVNSAVSHHHNHENSSATQLLQPYSSELPNFESVLNPSSSSNLGAIHNNSPFNSQSNQPDCNFTDEDLEKSFELHIDDPEIATSRLLEDSGLTEDDLNDLFPASENKLGSDLDFSTNFDTNDIDYSLFANIFPNFRSQPESLVTNQF